MRPLFGFGLSQEDERTEAAALALPGGRVLSIASAGDLPLSLVALGAEQVTAVDCSLEQIHLATLKRAAVEGLDRERAIRFLGLLPARPVERVAWFESIGPLLPPATHDYWEAHLPAIRGGAVWAGRFERYLAAARLLLHPLLAHRFEALFASPTLEAQRLAFSRAFDRPVVHGAFQVLFHPRLYRHRAINARALRHRAANAPLGLEFFERFREMCTATPAPDNYLLQLAALGRVRDVHTVPTYLTPTGFEVARRGGRRLSLHRMTVTEAVESFPSGSFDRFHLSNVSDWLAPDSFDQLLEAIVRRAARPARLVWRYLHREPGVPASLASELRLNRALGSLLREADRFPIYAIVPAEIAT